MIEEKKFTYEQEVRQLLRQQYKFSPKLIGILTNFAGQVQEVEDALYEFYDYNKNYSVFVNEENYADPIIQIGRHFNVLITNPLNAQDVIERVLAQIWVSISHGRPSDITGLSKFVYNYESNFHETRGFLVLTVQGDISSDSGRKGMVLYDALRKMMPPTIVMSYICESNPRGAFSFSEFGADGLGWTNVQDFSDQNEFARVVIDTEGNYVEGIEEE